MMGRFEFEKPIIGASMTLPRLSDGSSTKPASKHQPKKPTRLDISAPRVVTNTNTLPSTHSNLSTSPAEPDTNPLRILRDKNFPIVRPRMKVTVPPVPPIARDTVEPDDGVCESPSYLTQAEYSFNEASTSHSTPHREIENLNPIPLPPRDRNKPMPTNVKRHVRKHPLIIPASGLQRTLSKVVTPVEEKNPQFPTANESPVGQPTVRPTSFSNNRPSLCKNPSQAKDNYAQQFIENNFPAGDSCNNDRTYENLDTLRFQMQVDCTDSASLHFESILEDGGCNVADVMASPDVTGDFMFEIQKDTYYKPGSAHSDADDDVPDEIRNLDIEQKKLAFSQKYPKYVQPQNELANNILFNKLKESAEATAITDGRRRGSVGRTAVSIDEVDGSSATASGARSTTGRCGFGENSSTDTLVDDSVQLPEPGTLQHSNSVSCEDLLEFSDQKPKGRERGFESDEVRIMTKVLGGVASPDQFIEALNFIDWDVHKAIKLIMLRKTLSDIDLTLQQCVDALQLNEWDMQSTTIRLKGH